MNVKAELGIVRKVRTELDEEGTKVAVLGVEVIVIDHGGGSHQPGIASATLLVRYFLLPVHMFADDLGYVS